MDTIVRFSKAKWITARDLCPSGASIFVRSFAVTGGVRAAKVLASAMGMYDLFINGRRVGDALFTPGFTAYKKRVQVQEYDVAALLCEGENTLAISVGKGWAASEIQFAYITDHVSAICELSVDFESGESLTVGTDADFSVYSSPVLFSPP